MNKKKILKNCVKMNEYSRDPFMGYVNENEKLYMYKSTNLYEVVEPIIHLDCKLFNSKVFDQTLQKVVKVQYFCKECEKVYKSKNGLKYHKLYNHIEKKLRRSSRINKK